MANEDYKMCMMRYHPFINMCTVEEYENWLDQVDEEQDEN